MDYTTLLKEQQEEIQTLFQRRIIPREKLGEFQPLMSSHLIKVVTGIRRCGKSVFLHDALRSNIPYAYVNFDDERLVGLKATDLNAILEALLQVYPHAKTYYFDEIQNVLGWELFVNRLQRQGFQIYVTGSNAKLLSKELATHLTGRHLEMRLMPFSFREFLSYHHMELPKPKEPLTSHQIAEYMRLFKIFFDIGGFPEVVAGESSGIYLRNLFDHILMRDIVTRYHLRYANQLKELARYLMNHPGIRFTYNSLNKTFQTKTVHTIQKYIEFFKETFLMYELLQFDFKKKEQLKKPRKMYPCDLGMHRALGTESYHGEGRRLEMVILAHLLFEGYQVYYSHISNSEIDFISEKNGKVVSLIQACYSLQDAQTAKREIQALEKGTKMFHCKKLYILTWNEEDKISISKNLHIHVIPVWKWLLGII